ncbi:MAG TPA: hypothetical protein VGX78_02020, partial [Pirellulales bacterium]|nr:hypothetical protein [Pirellulales bacterium]
MSTLLEPRSSSRSTEVVGQLEHTCSGLRTCQVAAAFARLGLIELALVAAFVLADWFWITSTAIRALGLSLMAAAAASSALRTMGRLRRLGRGEAAICAEESFPQLGQRVRTTLEYVEPSPITAPASPGLVDALVSDTDRQTRVIDFQTLIPWRRVRWQAAMLAVLSVAGLAALAVSPELRIAFQRMLLVPAHYTRLTVKPGDRQVKVGGDVLIQAELTGRTVRQIELRYRPVGNPSESAETHKWQIVPLGRPESDDVANEDGQAHGAAIAGTVEKK